MPRPGGNPEITKYSFTTDRGESCTAYLGIRIQPSQLEALKTIPHYQEKVREAIRALVESAELEQTQLSGPGDETEPPPLDSARGTPAQGN